MVLAEVMDTPTRKFQQDRYVHLTGVLEPGIVQFLQNYVLMRASNNQMTMDDQCPRSFAQYGDTAFDTIMAMLCEGFSNIAGEPLIPTYSYHRKYQKGEILAVHRDRPSCEISATCTIAVAPGNEPSALYASQNEPKHQEDGQEIIFGVGDAVLYKGCELYHWRKPMEPEWQIQAFFHYVRANGPHADWAFDKRPRLGMAK